MDVGVYTLGCKANQSESETLQQELLRYGFDLVDPREETADGYVLNSCSITVSAQASGRKMARRFRRRNPDALIVFTGCYAELKGDELSEELPEVDYIVGTADKSSVPRLLLEEADPGGLNPAGGESRVAFRSRKFLKIQDGCRDWCTFCIVPHVRPELHSLPPDRVLERLRRLDGDGGYNEIVLSGVHLGEYGVDLEGNENLTRLTRRLAEADLDCRIRFSSVEPQDVTAEMVETIADHDRFCNHLHLPVQSGSNRILNRMQRNYDREYVLDLAEECRRHDPDFALNTDIICGFPGETEEDHERTLELIRSVGFSRLHVFRYSPRPGTAGSKMDDPVHSKTKKKRVRETMALGETLQARYAERFEGRRDEVIVEDRRADDAPVGYTEYYLPARVPADVSPGERIPVQLGSFGGEYFDCEVVGEGP